MGSNHKYKKVFSIHKITTRITLPWIYLAWGELLKLRQHSSNIILGAGFWYTETPFNPFHNCDAQFKEPYFSMTWLCYLESFTYTMMIWENWWIPVTYGEYTMNLDSGTVSGQDIIRKILYGSIESMEAFSLLVPTYLYFP